MFTSVKKMVSTFESRQQPQPSSVMSSSSSVLTSKHPKRELESSLTRCTSAGHLFAKPCCSAPSSPTLKRAAGFHVSPCSVRLQSPALHSSHPDLQHCPLRSAPSAPHPSPRHPSFPSLHLPTSSEKSRDGAQKKEGWPRSKARDSWPSSHMEVRHGVQRCPKSMYWEHGGSDFSDKEEQWYFTDSSAPMLAGSHGVPRTVGLGVSRGAEFPQSRGGPPLLTSGAPCRTASVSRFKTVPQPLTGPQPRPTGTCQLEKQPGIHITVSRNVLCASAHKPLNLTLPQPPPALQSKLNVGRASPKAYPRDELKQDAFQPIPTEVVTPRPNHTQAQCHLFVPDNAAPIVQTHPHCGSDVDLDSSGSTEVQGYLNSNPNVDGSQTMTKIGLQDLNPLTYLMQPVGGSMAVEKVWTTGAKGIVGAEQLNSAVGQGSIHVSPHWSQGTASTVRCIGSSQNSIPQRPVQNCISSDSQTSNHDGSDVNNAAGTVNQGTQRCSGADMKECQDSLAAEASPHSSITSTPGIATPITVQSPPSALSCSNVLGRSPSGSIADGPVAVATCVVGCRPADVISSSGALSQQNPRYSRLAGQVVPSGQKAPTRNSDKAFLALLLFIHSGSSNSMVAIDNKIEQAMDLVKTHLMMAVREEVEILREQIKELTERNAQLERENYILRALRERD